MSNHETFQLHVSNSITTDAAKQLSITTNTVPQKEFQTPNWLLRMLPWVDVETGIYRINRIKKLVRQDTKFQVEYDESETPVINSDALRQIDLFYHMSNELIEKIAANFQHKKIKKNEVVISENDTENKFYIILDGQYEVSTSSRSGNKMILSTLTDGDFFGEILPLKKNSKRATVVATIAGNLLALDTKSFQEVLKDKDIKQQLEYVFNQRQEKLNKIYRNGERRLSTILSHTGDGLLPHGYIDYDEHPQELHLNTIQTVIGINTQIMDLYNVPYNQLEHQISVAITAIRECEENEIINHPKFGLLANVDASMTLPTRNGSPTPDDLDDLLALLWKQPSIFLAHPKAIAAFTRECTYRGVPPEMVEIFGTKFITWRGIPLIPTDKLGIKENHSKNYGTTDILLLRTGEANQGVVGLHKANLNSYNIPSLNVRYMNTDDYSIANYLISKFFGVAVLVPDAIARLTHVEIGNYHEYK